MVLLRPFFFQGRLQSLLIWSGVGVACWLTCLYLGSSLSFNWVDRPPGHLTFDRRAAMLSTGSLFFGPFLETTAVGQINTMALLFVTGSLVSSELDRAILSGVSIASAILLKTSPLRFSGNFVLTRRFRVVVCSAIGTFLFTHVSAIPCTTDVTRQFLGILEAVS